MVKRVSVIVSVHNIQDYVSDCIRSIVDQDYSNLEIILVDDGSTDRSLKICENFAAKDPRIRVIYEESRGAGAARNHGVDCSTGDYITFIDGDDIVENNYVSTLVEQKEKFKSDIAITFNKEFYKDTYYVLLDPAPSDEKYDGIYSPVEWLKTFFPTRNSAYNSACMKLYDRSLFNTIKYPEPHIVLEDAFTTWKLILSAKRISFQNILTYNYRKNRPDSITTNGENSSFHYSDVKVLEEKIATMNASGLDTSYMYGYYKKCLQLLNSTALKAGDYQTAKSTQLKIQLISKYDERKEKSK